MTGRTLGRPIVFAQKNPFWRSYFGTILTKIYEHDRQAFFQFLADFEEKLLWQFYASSKVFIDYYGSLNSLKWIESLFGRFYNGAIKPKTMGWLNIRPFSTIFADF